MTWLRRQHVKYMWTTLSDMLLFFVEKCSAKDSHIFSTKNNSIFDIFQNFNETVSNNIVNVVNFEQPGLDV